jgi:hypothetical protein
MWVKRCEILNNYRIQIPTTTLCPKSALIKITAEINEYNLNLLKIYHMAKNR